MRAGPLPIKIRHMSRLIVFLLLALCLAQTDGGRFLDDGQELSRDTGFILSAPGHAGATTCGVEPLHRTSPEFLEQGHVLALSPDRLAADFVRAAAFLSGATASRPALHCAHRSIATRAPPFFPVAS